jgi:Ni,Fe-hydrogenase III small subunit
LFVEPSVSDLKGMEEVLRVRMKKILGRSLAIRELDAGSCNGCEVEVNALSNPVYDIERLGMKFVASPRHADLLLVTGPVTRNMEQPLQRTYQAMPRPRIVAAMGACSISGGIFRGSYTCHGGVAEVIPVDVFIPGCPPRPQAIIQGIMEALDRLEEKRRTGPN